MIKKIKHLLRLKLMQQKNSSLFKILVKLNMEIFHRDEKEKKITCGSKNPDKTFYVIRSGSMEEGLLSLFNTTMRSIEYCKMKGYIPIVDMENYKTQYNESKLINGTLNAWEYYFMQPTKIALDEVYNSRNVILSGWNKGLDIDESIFNLDYSPELNSKRFHFIQEYTGIQDYIYEEIKKQKNSMFEGKILGIYVRGTDYIALRPKGHPIQPNIDVVIEKADEFIKKYAIDKIFIVTEDFDMFTKFKNKFGDMIISYDTNFVKNYTGKDYLINYFENISNYERGLEYLKKMLFLTECDYLVTTLTNGSMFSLALSNANYKDIHVFNIGKYNES